jgi:hypothetical protein
MVVKVVKSFYLSHWQPTQLQRSTPSESNLSAQYAISQ